MKPRYAAALAFIVLASCGPDLARINRANEQAESAAERTRVAQLRAERAAELAAQSEMKTRDQESAMCSTCDACHLLTGAAHKRYEFHENVWRVACGGDKRLRNPYLRKDK
jgi:hypothetical protein